MLNKKIENKVRTIIRESLKTNVKKIDSKYEQFMKDQINKILEYLKNNNKEPTDNKAIIKWVSENSEKYRELWINEHGEIDGD